MQNKLNNQLRIISIVLLFITGLNALTAGYSFIADPSGKGLGINVDYLKYSPFIDFFIPGLVLFFVIGIISTFVAILSILKKPYYPVLISFQGCIITGWILIQVLMLRIFHALHLTIFIFGVSLIILGLQLRVKEELKH